MMHVVQTCSAVYKANVLPMYYLYGPQVGNSCLNFSSPFSLLLMLMTKGPHTLGCTPKRVLHTSALVLMNMEHTLLSCA